MPSIFFPSHLRLPDERRTRHFAWPTGRVSPSIDMAANATRDFLSFHEDKGLLTTGSHVGSVSCAGGMNALRTFRASSCRSTYRLSHEGYRTDMVPSTEVIPRNLPIQGASSHVRAGALAFLAPHRPPQDFSSLKP